MNTLKNNLELATILVRQLVRAEQQCLTYLKVMAHKTDTQRLKAKVLSLLPRVQKKLQYLKQLANKLQVSPSGGATLGINGIVSEGFALSEEYPNSTIKDEIILQTVILLSHYKLGAYRILQSYLQPPGFEYEAYLAENLIDLEETTITRLMSCKKEHSGKKRLESRRTEITNSFQLAEI